MTPRITASPGGRAAGSGRDGGPGVEAPRPDDARPRIGALAYDLSHNLALPGAAVAVGLVAGSPWLVLVGALVVVHVGIDRLLGYGLKYPSGFRDTHLQRV